MASAKLPAREVSHSVYKNAMDYRQALTKKAVPLNETAYEPINRSGERGIRTPGGITLNGFQDRRNRPLCHLSAAKV